jgi:large conductance mechanosensitive channel protein
MARQTKHSNIKNAASSGNINLEAPYGHRRPVSKKMAPVMKKPVTGFVDFLREQSVVGLAVGFIVGTQAKDLVDQLVKSFIDPFVGVIIGASSLSQKTFVVYHGGHKTVFAWGAFVYSLLDFVIVLLVIYVVVKLFSLEKLDKKKSA